MTEKEEQRKIIFEQKKAELQSQGYECIEKIISPLKANLLGLLVMIPFAVLAFIVYFVFSPDKSLVEISWLSNFWISYVFFIVCFFALIFIHELIHGICFSHFNPLKWKSVSFGFNVKAFAPYCTCSEPLTKKAYVISALMPTLILGFLLGFVATFLGSDFLMILSCIMIFGGAGDFLMVFVLLRFKTKDKEVLIYDHPYLIGSVFFVR